MIITRVLLIMLILAVTVFGRDFSKTFSVSGGSAQQLSTLLVASGYSGPPDQIHTITICVPDANVNTLYIGQSNVNASNGFPVSPGSCDTVSMTSGSATPIQTSGIYVYIATTENESFQVHGQ